MKKLSIQWRLTLAIAALVTVTCILLNLLISHSAVTGIDTLEDYTIQLNPPTDELLSVRIDPNQFLPELTAQIQKTKTLFYVQSAISTIVIILISSFITYFLAGRTLSPLKKLSAQIKKVQAQNLSVPLEIPKANDEISLLTCSFNEMLARLDESFTVQRQFSANAAHELRTPLAVIQTQLDVFEKKDTYEIDAYKKTFSMIQEQTNRLSHLVEILLDMTNLQTVQRTDTVSLFELTEEVFCDLDQIAAQKQVKLIQQDGDCIITGSYILLYRAVYNLVENAIKYNHPSGSVTVQIRKEQDTAVLMVSDTGIGIPPENFEKVFDPFFRVDKSRSRAMGGSGLGLALVKAISQQHGGRVQVTDSSPAGTTITFSLPANTDK